MTARVVLYWLIMTGGVSVLGETITTATREIFYLSTFLCLTIVMTKEPTSLVAIRMSVSVVCFLVQLDSGILCLLNAFLWLMF